MLKAVLLALTAAGALADQDAIFLNFGAETVSEDLGSLVAEAEKSSRKQQPLLLFVLPALDLAEFSRLANVYTDAPNSDLPNLKKAMLGGSYFGARVSGSLGEALEAAPSVLYYTAEDEAQLASSPLVVLKAASWPDLDRLAAEVLPVLGKKYRALVLGSEARVRSKRAADDADAPEGFYEEPNCIAFALGATITKAGKDSYSQSLNISNAKLGPCYTNTSGSDQHQTNMTFTFTGTGKVTKLGVKMGFVLNPDRSWVLDTLSFQPQGDSAIQGDFPVSEVNLLSLYLNSVLGFSYACGSTPPIWITKGKELSFSVQLTHFQVDPFNEGGKFSDSVDDCVPFFTPGIWMSIFSLVILALTLIFGLVMISSLKTMDKFDDPKGKPLHINAKD